MSTLTVCLGAWVCQILTLALFLQIELDEDGYVKTVPGTTQTNIPGKFQCLLLHRCQCGRVALCHHHCLFARFKRNEVNS